MAEPVPPGSVALALTGLELPVRESRRFAVHCCESAGITALSEGVALVVTELVTNAVLHGEGPRRLIVRVRDDGVWVAVEDPSGVPPRLRSPSPRSDNGRGLQLTKAFAQSWGHHSLGAEGKQVWALVTPASVAAAESQALAVLLAEVERS